MHLWLNVRALVIGSTLVALSALGDCSSETDLFVCSEAGLRAAIQRGGVIGICCTGEIVLTRTIEVTNSVALVARTGGVVISGGNRVRLFNVAPGITFFLTNLVLANGMYRGVAGTNAPAGQRAQDGFPGEAGAIYNAGGTVQLTGCVLTNNQALGGGGGTSPFGQSRGVGGIARGGAIANVGGRIVLQSVVCVSNYVVGGPGGFEPSDPTGAAWPPYTGGDALGGVLWSSSGTVTITDSHFLNNVCQGGRVRGSARGGAINQENAYLSMINSSLISNRAQGSAAGLDGSPGSAYGGAIYSTTGAVMLDQAIVRSNSAVGGDAYRHAGPGEAHGGAIYSEATLTIHNSDVSANEARVGRGSTLGNPDAKGGALYLVGGTTLSGSIFSRNLAHGSAASGISGMSWPASDGYGGAILNNGDLRVTNCTLALNQARGGDPSCTSVANFPGSAYGGAIFNSGRTECINVTIASNFVSTGTNQCFGRDRDAQLLGANIASANGSFFLRNSILAHGRNGTNAWTNVWGGVIDGGHNMSSDNSANFPNASSFNSMDPRLGPLADNGGPTMTMGLSTNSPAIDAVGADFAPATDQRGLSRPYGRGADIGAFEWQPEPPRLIVARANTEQVVIGFAAGPHTAYRLQSAPALTGWTNLETIGPFPGRTNIFRTFPSRPDAERYFRMVSP